MTIVLPVLMLFIGLGLGSLVVWLLLKSRIAHEYDRAKAEAESERAVLVERLESRDQTISKQEATIEQQKGELRSQQEQITALKAREAQLITTIKEERQQAADKIAVYDDAQKKLTDAFKALASDALNTNNEAFLNLAKEKLESFQKDAKGDLEKRQTAIDNLVKPMEKSLKEVDGKLKELETARVKAYTTLESEIKSLGTTHQELRSETSQLVKALRQPTTRGRWGEIQLRRVVEMAGMLNRCDFCEQQSVDGEDGQLRPDLTVRLPGEKNIVVDAKAPISAFLEAMEATDDATRSLRLKAHAEQVRGHIAALSKKSYFEQFDHTPEFVVLFLPGDAYYSVALEHDPTLIEVGLEHNVILATPVTLIGLLRAVAYGWRQEKLAQNAKEISDLGRELYKRIAGTSGHLVKLGRALNAATEAYNKTVGSVESRVLASARKFNDLDVGLPGVEIQQIPQVEHTTRLLQAPELVEGEAVEIVGNGDGEAVKPR